MVKKVKSKVEKLKFAKPKFQMTNEKEIAMDFALKVHEKFDRLIKATILFGSQAKGKAVAGSDIDIILVIDDSSISWDLELISWYREELGKLVSAQNYGKDLHLTTVKLTTWWNDLLIGDSVVINMLRYGEALIDSGGFFNPIKTLLLQGRIHSTPEAAYVALQRAPAHLSRSYGSVLGAIEGVYWCMVDSAHAALIMDGKIPPSPEHVSILLKESFVDRGLLDISYVSAFRDVYALHKQIAHGEVRKVMGDSIDRLQKTAEDFMLRMTNIVDTLIKSQKNV